MRKNLRPCPRCSGTGWLPLPDAYRETLDAMRPLNHEINGAQLAAQMSVHPTAMNNRLVVLKALGMVIDRRDGRQRLWRIK
jgi:DNA-binding transcriptional ArsR family regulator